MGVFSFGDKDFREVDREEDELVVEVAGPEFVPELDEDGLGFRVSPSRKAILPSSLRSRSWVQRSGNWRACRREPEHQLSGIVGP
jgi:hypothetical protein